MKKLLKNLLLLTLLLSICQTYAQQKVITFELNGFSEKEAIQNSKNPFSKYVGEWTLKEDSWTQNWGQGTQTIKIPNHHTVSFAINTNNSLLSIIDGPAPNGHIFWSYNPISKEVHHLSSFGTERAGKGKGTINTNGDIQLKLTFEGEPNETYRQYTYQWLNDNEYELKSVQFDKNNQPTGLFYGGTFIRINPSNQQQITAINQQISKWYQQQQVDSIIQLYDKATTFMPEYKPALYEPKSIQHFYSNWWLSTAIKRYQKTIFEVHTFGNHVVEIGTFLMDYTLKNDTLKHYTGNYMILWKKSNSGKWTILSEIFNADKYLQASESPYARVKVKETSTLPTPNIHTALHNEILERNKWIKKVVEAGDGPARVKGFASDAVYLPHFHKMKIGLQEIAPYLLNIYKPEAQLKTDQYISQIYDFENYVLTIGHYKGGWKANGGGTFEGNMLNLYKRDNSGKLVMYRQLTNNDR